MTTTLATTRLRLGGGATLAALGAVGLALSMPEDAKLGALVRFVTFHGASTWVNMALFTVLGVFGLAYLVTGKPGISRWEAALRYVTMSLWLVNTVMGMISSTLAWGAVNWSEPRLQASFYILIAAGVVLIVDVLVDRPMVSSAADLLLSVSFWALLLSSPNLMHPDNPVLNSGPEILFRFFGMVALWGAAMVLAAALLRTFFSTHARGAADEAAAEAD